MCTSNVTLHWVCQLIILIIELCVFVFSRRGNGQEVPWVLLVLCVHIQGVNCCTKQLQPGCVCKCKATKKKSSASWSTEFNQFVLSELQSL